MDFSYIIITIAGLCLFEVICSIDNAIINAEVLSGMAAWARRWFLVYGLFIAVFVIRAILPWLIVWMSNPALGPVRLLPKSGTDRGKEFPDSLPSNLTGVNRFFLGAR